MFGMRNITAAILCLTAVASIYANSALLSGEESVTTLQWKPGVIRLAISASFLRENSNIKRDSDVAGAIRRSIETWSRVADLELVQISSDKSSVSPAGAAGDGVNLITGAATAENVLLFSKDPEGSAATTRIFYNRRGIITEADIVLNPYQQFSTDGTLGTFDLESTLTHEIGHLLGLPHSLVIGSTMHANYGKNGVFGLQNVSSRTLSEDDIAAVRALYGAADQTDCCGSIEGRLSMAAKPAKGSIVWIEDAAGRVNGSTKTLTDGDFRFSGLTSGKYRVYAQAALRTKVSVPVHEIAEAVVSAGETATVSGRLGNAARDFELTYLGFNGQLSEMAVSLSPGRTYVLYLGGRSLDPKKLSIGFSNPHISLVPGTLRAHDYGADVSVISLEIRVGLRTPKGEYSIFVESERGDRQALIGGLTIDNFANPWSGFAVFDD